MSDARPAPSEAMAAILQLGADHALPDHDRVEDRRAATEAALLGPAAEGTVCAEAPLGGRPALWISPVGRDSGTGRIVLYVHGGAFEVGSPFAYRAFCSNLSLLLDAPIVIPDYRLAPEHPFPAAVEDVVAAYRGLLDQARPALSIVLIGDSAGGGLVLSCLIAAQQHSLPQPAAAIGLSSWTDLTLESDTLVRCADTDPFIRIEMLRRATDNYLGTTDPHDPLASPVFAAPARLVGLAPLLLLAAANEVLADDSTVLAQRITAAGGDVTLELFPVAFHAWPLAGDALPESHDALDAVRRFAHQHWR
jgi:monoterpene epsilon-lactone hydrolase